MPFIRSEIIKNQICLRQTGTGALSDELPMRTKEYEGVDLYRTEIFLIARGALTTEDEQHRLYQDLLECLAHSCTEIDLPTR